MVDIIEVKSAELHKEYERMMLESFADQGRDQDEILSEKEGEIWRYLVRLGDKFIGTGRVAKIKDTFYFQRGSVLKEYRSNGIFAVSLKMGVDWIYTFKKPAEKIAIFVNIFSKTPAEKVGFKVDYEHPSRVANSPLIYYKAYHDRKVQGSA